MHILLTGVTGYIGKRLMQSLLHEGHNLTCCVRDVNRFSGYDDYADQIHIIETDFSNDVDISKSIRNVDAAYFLIHSLKNGPDFYSEEAKIARNFVTLAEKLDCKQVIYLGGIANESGLSKHLSSRKNVEDILKEGPFALTIFRAAIIVGSGSASFEIIRDLVEKLPIMITPKWVNTKCQPIAVRDVIQYLKRVLLNEATYNRTFDIGGPDVLTYKDMMLQYAKVRQLKRYIFTVPVMTPRLSSYWLYFITATNYSLAVNLVNSMKVKVVCENNDIRQIIPMELCSYRKSVERAFDKIKQNMVVSSWTDALSSSNRLHNWKKHIQLPTKGCFIDKRQFEIQPGEEPQTINNIWSIGGDKGWYFCNWLWKLRGYLDKLLGGVGLRRGRANAQSIKTGEALDFWRVLVADKTRGRLLLYAEMKLPGEAWLEFKIQNNTLIQQATFRPKGITGRMYWYLLVPMHNLIFNGMSKAIVKTPL